MNREDRGRWVVGTRPSVAPAVGLMSSKVLHLHSTTELPRGIKKKKKKQILEPIVLIQNQLVLQRIR